MGVKFCGAYECVCEIISGGVSDYSIIFLAVLASLGIVGNVVNASVFSQRDIRSPITILLLSLAGYDFLVCFGYATVTIWSFFLPDVAPLTVTEEWYIKHVGNISKWSSLVVGAGYEGSCYTITIIAVERVMVISFDAKPRITKNLWRTVLAIVILLIVVLLLSATTAAFYNTSGESNRLVAQLRMFATMVVPLLCTGVCNVLTAAKLVSHIRHKSDILRTSTHAEKQATCVLLGLVTSSLLSLTFCLVADITQGYYTGSEPTAKGLYLKMMVAIVNTFNCSTTVLLYLFFNSSFRKALCKWGQHAPTVPAVFV